MNRNAGGLSALFITMDGELKQINCRNSIVGLTNGLFILRGQRPDLLTVTLPYLRNTFPQFNELELNNYYFSIKKEYRS